MLKKIRENKKGFTLAELLIVVAIIAVLVAISIPIFTSQLEKSRDAVTASNIRAAYAEAATEILTGDNVAKDTSGNPYVDKTVVVKGTQDNGAFGKAAGSGSSAVNSSFDLPFNVAPIAANLDKKPTNGDTITVRFTYTANTDGSINDQPTVSVVTQ